MYTDFNMAPETDPLTDLALKYGGEAQNEVRLGYTPYYYTLFKNRRRSIRKVLEIGIGDGMGLRMWRDFFVNAKIYGVDYRPETLITEPRIESILADQRRREHLEDLIKTIGSNIDLVIDDGSHRSRDQFFTCSVLMPLLNKNVTYIIEDVSDISVIKRLGNYDISVPSLPALVETPGGCLVVVRNP